MRITKASLLNGQEISFGDFNVFIGGNGVGKTTIISELFHKVTEIQRNKYWWINALTYSSDDIARDARLLSASMSRRRDGFNLFFFSNASKGIDGNVDLDDELKFTSTEVEGLTNLDADNFFGFKKTRRPLISFSSCDSRLSLQNEAALTRRDHPPQDPINVLDRNRTLLNEIDRSIFEIFKYHFVLLSHVGTSLQIGISKTLPPAFNHAANSIQEEFEKIESWKQDNFIPITEAGHGIRSMIKLLTSLLEPVNQVIIIDEPEMHLYPSQKRWLGKQLVSLAAAQSKQVFVVTHDPMVLQGILDANTKTNIFRVDRDDAGAGVINFCEFNKPEATHSRNQEQYLQGLFYQRCIVVEGASDRSFYQEMLEEYPAVQDKDLGVVVAGGVGNSKHMVDIAAKVGLKAAFIYDLDVLIENQPLIKDIFTALGGEDNPMEKLEAAYDADPTVHNAVPDQKQAAIKKITGYARKSGFSTAWQALNRLAIDEAVANLATVGIFIVPDGTLESWAPDVEEKVRFAEEAPAVIRANAVLKEKLDGFSKKVLSCLGITT